MHTLGAPAHHSLETICDVLRRSATTPTTSEDLVLETKPLIATRSSSRNAAGLGGGLPRLEVGHGSCAEERRALQFVCEERLGQLAEEHLEKASHLRVITRGKCVHRDGLRVCHETFLFVTKVCAIITSCACARHTKTHRVQVASRLH